MTAPALETSPFHRELNPESDLGGPPVETPVRWPLWQRVLFRFFFTYLALHIAPWGFFAGLAPIRAILAPLDVVERWAVFAANSRFFHVRETLVMPNGSGDTSYMYAQFYLFLSLAAITCVVWSVLDRKRASYGRLLYWLRLSVRYYITIAALSYGIIKIFALQMFFPTISQLATPLGDLLPMRFSWLFIGYSVPYQTFAGVMEFTAGVLLLYRRTVTAGLLAALGAFANVVMINLSYDVPVKLYASHLLFCCLFLLALDYRRLVSFFVMNQATPGTAAYDWPFGKPWQRYGGMAVKALMLWMILVTPLYNSWKRYESLKRPPAAGPFKVGVYNVTSYARKRGATPVLQADSMMWKDVIFDNAGAGSVNTKDPVFTRRYGRGYFRFKPDTSARTVAVWKTSTIPGDSTFLFTMRYAVPDTTRIQFWTAISGDSLFVELARTNRHFQLTERQFHWLSEYNR